VPVEIRADNAIVKSSILESLCEKFNIRLTASPILRPCANGQIERLHKGLKIFLKDVMEDLSLPRNRWDEALHVVANCINNSPHMVTGYTPHALHSGRSNLDFPPKEDQELIRKFAQVRSRLEKQQKDQLYTRKGPFPNITLCKNDPIYVMGSDQTAVPAIVIKDYGNTVMLEKLNENDFRFKYVTAHKSLISRRLES